MTGFLQVGVEVEQHVDRLELGTVNVAEYFLRLLQVYLRIHDQVDAVQADRRPTT